MLSGFRSFIVIEESVEMLLRYLLETDDDEALRQEFEKGRSKAPWQSRTDHFFGTNPKVDKSNLLGADVGKSANINHDVLNRTLGNANGYESYIVHLTPAAQSGFITCPCASSGCKSTCLQTSGNIGALSQKTGARLGRTWFIAKEMPYVLSNMSRYLQKLKNKVEKRGNKLVIRMNGTSDLHWEDMRNEHGKTLMEEFPDVVFYDYTKVASRMGATPPNYHLTFSRSENNEKQSLEMLQKGHNVAVVFGPGKTHNRENLTYPDGRPLLPVVWNGFRVISGDKHDLRFLEQQPSGGKGLVIGLVAKGASTFESYSTSENKFLNKSWFVVQPSDPSIANYRENAEFVKIATDIINERNNSQKNMIGGFAKTKAMYNNEQRIIAGLLTGELSPEEKARLAKEPHYKSLIGKFDEIEAYCKKYPSMCRRDYLAAAGKKHSVGVKDAAGEPTFSPMPFDQNRLKAMGIVSGSRKQTPINPEEKESEFKAWLASREKAGAAPPRISLPLV